MLQIYLPSSNIDKNNAVLAEDDLNHQRNAAVTILQTIASVDQRKWLWHPGVSMWIGSEDLLAHIAITINEEWAQQVAASHGETRMSMNGLVKQYHECLAELGFIPKYLVTRPEPLPWWWFNKQFHACQRAMIMRHNDGWYTQFFPKTRRDLRDCWPIATAKNKFVMGPEINDGGPIEYAIHNRPLFKQARNMSNAEFADHANGMHNLMPDMHIEFSASDPTLNLMRILHDRFHQKRAYQTHDHL
jgi:hypothetical protein